MAKAPLCRESLELKVRTGFWLVFFRKLRHTSAVGKMLNARIEDLQALEVVLRQRLSKQDVEVST